MRDTAARLKCGSTDTTLAKPISALITVGSEIEIATENKYNNY